MHVGIGYDIHRFVDGKPLMLGGVEIPHIKGLEGHSDGDALLHAICDAILGAAGMDDIGHQFPVNDARYLNISSAELLKEVSEKIKKKGMKDVIPFGPFLVFGALVSLFFGNSILKLVLGSHLLNFL